MNHPIENIMQSSMEHIKALADVNTVIGSPIITEDNTMILPVSKVALGMLVGGGEYIAASVPKKSTVEIECSGNYPFIGTSTLGMSLTPLAFLAVTEGNVRVLPAKQDCSLDRLIDMLPQVIDTAERLMNRMGCDSGKKRGSKRNFCDRRTFTEPAGSETPAREAKRGDAVRIDVEYDGDEDR